MWLVAVAVAQTVTRVPPGEMVTVLMCADPTGCEAEARAMALHHAEIRRPLIGFDAFAADGPGGAAALRRWQTALERIDLNPLGAREALRALPFTVDARELSRVWNAVGAARVDAGADASAPYAASASVLSSDTSVSLRVDADVPVARVYVDGRDVGAAPAVVGVAPGWHRVTVERAGRHTAWVAEIDVEGDTHLHASVAADDAGTALQTSVLGALNGVPPPDDVTEALTAFARESGVRTLRFVELRREGQGDVEEFVTAADRGEPPWDAYAVYLDVSEGWSLHGTGPGRDDPVRVYFGATVGWLHLGSREHAAIELPIDLRLRGNFGLECAVGVLRTPEAYLLYDGIASRQLYTAALSARFGRWDGGPFAMVGPYAVVPWALGGAATAGWELVATRTVRLRLEATVVATDRGLGGGARVGLSARP